MRPNPPTVKQVKALKTQGPWHTKSHGELDVLFALDYQALTDRYFSYASKARQKAKTDIRGLRMYRVSKLKIGSIGANEWHALRNELVIVTHGSFQWICEDLKGGVKELTLTRELGVWVPPYILHSYKSLEDNSELLVLANTLFTPGDTNTHDTYSLEEFKDLQKEYDNN